MDAGTVQVCLALIAAGGAIAAAWISRGVRQAQEEHHRLINSRLEELLTAVKHAARHNGIAEGIRQERERGKNLPPTADSGGSS